MTHAHTHTTHTRTQIIQNRVSLNNAVFVLHLNLVFVECESFMCTRVLAGAETRTHISNNGES